MNFNTSKQNKNKHSIMMSTLSHQRTLRLISFVTTPCSLNCAFDTLKPPLTLFFCDVGLVSLDISYAQTTVPLPVDVADHFTAHSDSRLCYV